MIKIAIKTRGFDIIKNNKCARNPIFHRDIRKKLKINYIFLISFITEFGMIVVLPIFSMFS